MADSVVHIGENSPQQVAYKLMKDVMSAERVSVHGGTQHDDAKRADRAYLLSLYSECVRAGAGQTPK